jgi:cell division protein FtsA
VSAQIIFSLDIGSSKIVSIAGSIGENIEIHGISSYYFVNNSKNNDFLAVNNGSICDLEMIISKSTRALNEARINADCSVGGVVTSISGNNICNHYSEKSMDINNQVVTASTMQQLINDARHIDHPANYEILDYEVQEYVLDGENYAINPINLTANKISSNVNVFFANSSGVANRKKVLKNTGFDLAKLVPAGILSGMSVLNHEEKELGCCLIDIGAGTTDVVVYENGFIRYLASFPIGGERITRDIAAVLKISRNLAEDIKITYGGSSYLTTNTSQHRFGEGINLTDHRGVNTTISRKLLVDVITKRLKELFNGVKTTLEKEHLYDFAKHSLDLPVRIGLPNYSGDFADIVVNPRYATSIGALYFAREYMMDEIKMNKRSTRFKIGNLKEKIKGLFAG